MTTQILRDGKSRPWIPVSQNAEIDLGEVSPDVAEDRPGLVQTPPVLCSVLTNLTHNPGIEIEGQSEITGTRPCSADGVEGRLSRAVPPEPKPPGTGSGPLLVGEAGI